MGCEPERVPLFLDDGDGNSQNDLSRLLSAEVSREWSSVLYRWGSGYVCRPPSLLPSTSSPGGDNPTTSGLTGLFMVPPLSSQLSLLPEKALPLTLTYNQLESLRHKGKYIVTTSDDVEWGVVGVRGRDVLYDDLLDNVALGMRFVSVYVGDLWNWGVVRGMWGGVIKGVVQGVDLVVGVVRRGGESKECSGGSASVEEKVQHERCRFIVAELMCKREEAREVGRYVRSEVERAKREKVMRVDAVAVAVPYSFFTPQGQVVDLRLFDRNVLRRLSPILSQLLESANRLTEGWFLGYREKVIRELRRSSSGGGGRGGATEDEWEWCGMEGNRMIMDEYLRRLYAVIRASEEIRASGPPGIDRLLIEQAQLYVLMRRSLDEVEMTWSRRRRDLEKSLLQNHYLLSRDPLWLSRALSTARLEFHLDNRYLAHSCGIELCRSHGLVQSAYFLQRDLTFLRDSADVLRRELRRDLRAAPRRRWRWWSNETTTFSTSTSYPFWRVVNFLVRSVVFAVMVVRWAGVAVLGGGSVFGVTKFAGVVKGKITQNWRRVSKQVTQVNHQHQRQQAASAAASSSFGAKLGVWLWFGVAPTLFWGGVFPLVCLLVWTAAVVAVVGAPVWGPLLSLGYWAWCVLVYDLDSPTHNNNNADKTNVAAAASSSARKNILLFPLLSVFVRVSLGAVQALLAAIAVVLCPLATLLVILVSLATYGCRVSFEWVVFAVLGGGLKRGSGGFLRRRKTRRPLQDDVIYEMCGVQGILGYFGRLEMELLSLWGESELTRLCDPLEKYESFYTSVLRRWGCVLSEAVDGPYRDLVTETVALKETLDARLRSRKADLELGLGVSVRSKVRMRRSELEKVLRAAVKVTRSAMTSGDFLEGSKVEGVFSGRGLEVGDWNGLATCLFCEVFSQEVLTPLEEELNNAAATNAATSPSSDTCSSSSVHPPRVVPIDMCVGEGVVRFGERLLKEAEESAASSTSTSDPLVLSKVPYGPLHSPYLPLEAFNPAAHTNSFCPDVLSALGVGVSVPAPVLHPVWISVIICGREKDASSCFMDTDGPVWRAILRAVEEAGPNLNQECVSLNVVDDDSCSSSSSDDSEESSATSSSEGPPRSLQESGGGHQSKASLASPEDEEEELDLGSEVALTSYLGTSV